MEDDIHVVLGLRNTRSLALRKKGSTGYISTYLLLHIMHLCLGKCLGIMIVITVVMRLLGWKLMIVDK